MIVMRLFSPMVTMLRRWLIKYLVPAFYVVAIALVILSQWNTQNSIRQGSGSPLYRNLMEHPAFIKKGFNPAEILTIPAIEPSGSAETGGEWYLYTSSPPNIITSPLPGLPKRRFLSPFGREAEEFTIIILLRLLSEISCQKLS